jgi:putative 4-mercaptohistidine N1-methyltranferase
LSNPYESQELLDQYLLFHYGSADEVLPHSGGPRDALDFAVRTVAENIDASVPRGRALDLGCAVGRSSFELSSFCKEVVGIDFSSAFVDAADRLRRGEEIEYARVDEGAMTTPLVATMPAGAEAERISFEVGDAMSLRENLGSFEIVHAANLICRLPDPEKLLRRLPDLVAPGGVLVITTPCTWLGEFTVPENWPEGATIDWLGDHLAGDFERSALRDMPFLIREHARKYQWSVAQASVWLRR